MNELWGDFMKEHELLVPAGDMDCLRQAVYHGADAVYLACKNFGARKFATNFTNDEIVEAIRFCHLYGVKLYVTMNTLIRDDEVDSFIEQARFLHKHGVDALIVQDFGMICLLRKKFPNLEIHASTQANNSSYETVQLFYDLGVKRVVFSRELSIDEIDSVDVPIEKEGFIHGALCVSYSGCCLMSSMIGGRSGNRGECAGSCRLPYALEKNGKTVRENCYLLSMKELNTSSQMKRLLESSIYSFKIEGRMKGPVYVGFITDFYRKLMDGEKIDFEEMTNQLKSIFNREFTLGHLFGVEGDSLINSKSPNHIGLKIGRARVHKNKIQLDLNPGCVLHQHDSIRFLKSNKGMVVNYLYDQKDNLCSSSNGTCYVDNKVGLDAEDILMKTQDSLLEKEVLLEESAHRIPVTFKVNAKVGEPLKIWMNDSKHSVSFEGGEVLEAISTPTGEEAISEKLSKLGNTPFQLESVTYEMDSNAFIPIKVVNEMRRELVDLLKEEREKDIPEFVEKEVSFEKVEGETSFGITAKVYNEEQLKACLDFEMNRIYVADEALYHKYEENENVYYFVGRCHSNYQNRFQKRNCISDWMRGEGMIGNYFLNVTNIYTAYFLRELGLNNIPLSVELTEEEIAEIINSFHNRFGRGEFEIFQYGRVENMIIKSNILSLEENVPYHLVDFKKAKYPVYFDGEYTHILHSEVKESTSRVIDGFYYFDFYEEKKEDIMSIVKQFRDSKNRY